MKTMTAPLRSIFAYSGAYAKLYYAFLVLIGSFIIAASAQIEIPLYPVSVSLQSLAVVLMGMGLGPRLGTLTVIVYLIEGAIGLPVFAGFHSGIPTLLGMTGGYLFAFPFGAALAGWLVEHGLGKHFLGALASAIVGLALISLLGAAYLALFVGWQKAYFLGLAPFILGESLKAIFLAFIVPTLWRRRKQPN